ncbi:unnamed protein product [Peniophora sp. CBMAI 1063]|nr:unnamed protein product [Peniophora sp. CBMAI 1063]
MSQYCKMKEAAYMANRHVFSSGIISNAVQAAGAAVQEDLHSKSTLVDAVGEGTPSQSYLQRGTNPDKQPQIARSSGWAILYLKADDSSALWKWMFERRTGSRRAGDHDGGRQVAGFRDAPRVRGTAGFSVATGGCGTT